MKKKQKVRMCPVCGHRYTDEPALSRADNRTEICPTCGMKEALQAFISASAEPEEASVN